MTECKWEEDFLCNHDQFLITNKLDNQHQFRLQKELNYLSYRLEQKKKKLKVRIEILKFF